MGAIITLLIAYVILFGNYAWAGALLLYLILGGIALIPLCAIISSVKSVSNIRDSTIDYDNDNILTRNRINSNRGK